MVDGGTWRCHTTCAALPVPDLHHVTADTAMYQSANAASRRYWRVRALPQPTGRRYMVKTSCSCRYMVDGGTWRCHTTCAALPVPDLHHVTADTATCRAQTPPRGAAGAYARCRSRRGAVTW